MKNKHTKNTILTTCGVC